MSISKRNIIIVSLALLVIIISGASYFFFHRTKVLSTTTATPSPTFVFPEIHPTIPSYPPSHYLEGKKLKNAGPFKVPEDWETDGGPAFGSPDDKYIISTTRILNEQPYQGDFTKEEFKQIALGIFPERLTQSKPVHCASSIRSTVCIKEDVVKSRFYTKNGVNLLKVISISRDSDRTDLYGIGKTTYLIHNNVLRSFSVGDDFLVKDNTQLYPKDPSPLQVFDEIMDTFDPSLLD